MGQCVGREEVLVKNNLIIDVQKIIADDIWEEFLISTIRTCKIRRRWVKREDYTIEVPMNYYHFQEKNVKFQQQQRLPSIQPNAKGTSSLDMMNQANPDETGLKTKFRNDTDKAQTYNFRLTKTRTAAVEVTYQKGFSIGGSANFNLGLPKVLSDGGLGAEISMNYEVTSSKGQTFVETQTTEVTSEIVVSRFSHCVANIIMEERRLLASFSMEVTMSMPGKKAVCSMKDKHGKVVFLKVIQNLSMIFPRNTHILDGDDKTRADAVQFQVQGMVDGRQLANHYIHLQSRKLAKRKGEKTQPGKLAATCENDGVDEEEEEEEEQRWGGRGGGDDIDVEKLKKDLSDVEMSEL